MWQFVKMLALPQNKKAPQPNGERSFFYLYIALALLFQLTLYWSLVKELFYSPHVLNILIYFFDEWQAISDKHR